MASILQKIAPLLFLICFCTTISAQIKIGDNPQNIDPSSVLELESTSRVLVITRVNTIQMNAIIPSRGALVYNTDTECIHYYDGTQWINICDSIGGLTTITNVPSLTRNPTVLVTETANGNTINYNLEVGEITGSNIVDSTIGGADLSPRSVGSNNLAENSVGNFQLAENAVEDNEINFAVVTLSDFTNDAGYITTANIVSGDADNSILVGSDNAAFLNLNPLQNSVATNTAAIAADQDGNVNNETLTAATLDGNELVLTESGNETRVNLGAFSNSGSDDQDLESAILTGTDLAINIEDGNNVVADLSALGTDLSTTNEIQALSISGSTLTLNNGGGSVTLPTTDGGSLDIGDQFDAITIIGDGTAPNLYRVGLIGSPQIDDGSITVNDIGINAIQTTSIIDNNVTTPKIADANVTPIKIEPGTDGQFLVTTGGQPTWETITIGGTGTDDQTAAEVTYDPTTSGLTATNTQAAIDEIVAAGGTGTDDQTAAEVTYDPTTSGLTATNTQAAIDEIVAAGGTGTDDQTAAEVTYDPTTSGLTATNTQAAIDEIVAAGGTGTDDQTAAEVTYDPTTSGLTATNTQAAIDEIVANAGVSDIFNPITISGAGTALDPRTVANDGITADKIGADVAGDGLTQNITTGAIDILPGTANQVLLTNPTADGVLWADQAFGEFNAATISGNGTVATPFTVADDGVTANKIGADVAGDGLIQNVTTGAIDILPGTANQVLLTNPTADGVLWADQAFGEFNAVTISGNGTVATPFTVADDGVTADKIGADVAGDGLTQNITTGAIDILPGTANQVLLTNPTADGVLWADQAFGEFNAVTISGNGTVATPFTVADDGITADKIGADVAGDGLTQNITTGAIDILPGTANQVLLTNPTADGVLWADQAFGEFNAVTISGNGTVATPFTVADDGITADKIGADVAGDGLTQNITTGAIDILPGTANQVLLTNPTADGVLWADQAFGEFNAVTISGNGTVATPFTVANDGVTADKIGADVAGDGLTQNITTGAIDILPGTANQVLLTNPTADGVLWADQAFGEFNAVTISGNGTVATPFTVANDGITADKIGADVAGTGLQQNTTTGALEVDPAFSASSFSANIRTDPAAAVTIADTDYTVIINNAAAIVTLPAAAVANTGRIYILKNTTGGDITIDTYMDNLGAPSTTLAAGITQLQSDGTAWQQIN